MRYFILICLLATTAQAENINDACISQFAYDELALGACVDAANGRPQINPCWGPGLDFISSYYCQYGMYLADQKQAEIIQANGLIIVRETYLRCLERHHSVRYCLKHQ